MQQEAEEVNRYGTTHPGESCHNWPMDIPPPGIAQSSSNGPDTSRDFPNGDLLIKDDVGVTRLIKSDPSKEPSTGFGLTKESEEWLERLRKERPKFPTYFDNPEYLTLAVQRLQEKKANASDVISSLRPILCPSLSWISCANPDPAAEMQTDCSRISMTSPGCCSACSPYTARQGLGTA